MDASRYRPEIQADLEQDERYLEWRRASSEPPAVENEVAEEAAVYMVNEAPATVSDPPATAITKRKIPDSFVPWKPGQSGNPSGRPQGAVGLARYIQEHTDNGREMVKMCWSIACNPRAADKDRLRALEILLNRGYGAPLQLIRVLDEAEIERRSKEAGVDPELVKQHLRSQQK